MGALNSISLKEVVDFFNHGTEENCCSTLCPFLIVMKSYLVNLQVESSSVMKLKCYDPTVDAQLSELQSLFYEINDPVFLSGVISNQRGIEIV